MNKKVVCCSNVMLWKLALKTIYFLKSTSLSVTVSYLFEKLLSYPIAGKKWILIQIIIRNNNFLANFCNVKIINVRNIFFEADQRWSHFLKFHFQVDVNKSEVTSSFSNIFPHFLKKFTGVKKLSQYKTQDKE